MAEASGGKSERDAEVGVKELLSISISGILRLLLLDSARARMAPCLRMVRIEVVKFSRSLGFPRALRTSRYVVPTGRVKVPAGRYVVPTGKDNVTVSAGRSKVIPTGRTILVLVVLCLLRVDSIVS
ncbi:hypothetical protein Tco_0768523 [Tanacetum coccineum]